MSAFGEPAGLWHAGPRVGCSQSRPRQQEARSQKISGECVYGYGSFRNGLLMSRWGFGLEPQGGAGRTPIIPGRVPGRLDKTLAVFDRASPLPTAGHQPGRTERAGWPCIADLCAFALEWAQTSCLERYRSRC